MGTEQQNEWSGQYYFPASRLGSDTLAGSDADDSVYDAPSIVDSFNPELLDQGRRMLEMKADELRAQPLPRTRMLREMRAMVKGTPFEGALIAERDNRPVPSDTIGNLHVVMGSSSELTGAYHVWFEWGMSDGWLLYFSRVE